MINLVMPNKDPRDSFFKAQCHPHTHDRFLYQYWVEISMVWALRMFIVLYSVFLGMKSSESVVVYTMARNISIQTSLPPVRLSVLQA